jgi:PAS domain-containing protein
MTERRKAEEEKLKLLQLTKEEEERQHLQELIDTSPVGVLVVNAPTRQVALVNPEMQRIRGFSYQPGKTLDECDQGIIYRKPDGQPYEPEDLPLQRALDHGETVRAEEVKIDFPDGSTISTLVNATPILGPGRPDYLSHWHYSRLDSSGRTGEAAERVPGYGEP